MSAAQGQRTHSARANVILTWVYKYWSSVTLVLAKAMDTMMQVTSTVLINEMFLSLPSTDHWSPHSCICPTCNSATQGWIFTSTVRKQKLSFGLLQLHNWLKICLISCFRAFWSLLHRIITDLYFFIIYIFIWFSGNGKGGWRVTALYTFYV